MELVARSGGGAAQGRAYRRVIRWSWRPDAALSALHASGRGLLTEEVGICALAGHADPDFTL